VFVILGVAILSYLVFLILYGNEIGMSGSACGRAAAG
jgi:hypothetical protein